MEFINPNNSLFALLPLPLIEPAADGEDDDQQRHDEGPDVGGARGGADGVGTGDEALAPKLIMNHLAVVFAHAGIGHRARHHEVVGHTEGQEVRVLARATVVRREER